jgi:chemotaxis protein MotB
MTLGVSPEGDLDMVQYKSRDAWHEGAQQGAPEGQAEASPAAERQEPCELGDVTVPESRPGSSKKGPSLLPWVLFGLAVAAIVVFVVVAFLPAQRALGEAQRQLALAADANAKLTGSVEQLESAKNALEAAQANLQAAVQVKEQALAELTHTQDELSAKLQAEIAKGDVLINQRAGELVVDLVDQILFEPGEADLNEQGKAVLRKVGDTFAAVKDKVVQVGGHTDAMAISPKLKERFPTNWELSTTRASNVVRFLQEECGMPGERLVAAGFSQYRPVAKNTTKTGRRHNRRIEVVLLPLAATTSH